MFARAIAAVFAVVLLAFVALVALGALHARGRAWAVVDARGQPIDGARFDDADAFSEGLAAVSRRGRWGYVDRDGRAGRRPNAAPR